MLKKNTAKEKLIIFNNTLTACQVTAVQAHTGSIKYLYIVTFFQVHSRNADDCAAIRCSTSQSAGPG